MMRRLCVLMLGIGASLAPASVLAQQCLHGPDETAEQKARKREALQATRQINTLQANSPSARQGKFMDQPEMAMYYADLTRQKPATQPLIFDPASEVIPGWQLTLDKTEKGYWFMIKDKTDPCGFAYVSNQAGTIFTAEPIR
jgi:hypothetical protein